MSFIQPTATLIPVHPELVFANPYQNHSARRFRGDDFDSFVEDIRVNGVHQPPPARPHPDISGAVQLQMGHRRLAAWRVARPGDPFTVILKPLTDLDMLEGVIEENIHRSDLNDIERAQMIETYKQIRPDATNADMARVFKLKDPASITNIRKLLKLPPAIQTHVAENNLPDAIARQLVGIANLNAKTAQQIADKVAAAPKSQKQDVFEDTTRNLYWSKLIPLRARWWNMDWLADAPVTVERDLGDGDHLVGACAGCVFNVNGDCARKPCFEEKYKLWAANEVQRVAAQLKLAVASADEKTAALFKGEYNDDDNAKTLLNARKDIRAALRIAPRTDEQRHNYLARVLGSDAVTLVTTDKPALDAYFAELRAKSKTKNKLAKSEKPDDETDVERAKRIAAEKKEMDAKRAARSKMWKSYYDALWVMEQAALEIGAALVKQHRGVFVGFILNQFGSHFSARLGAEPIAARFKNELKRSQDAMMQNQWQLSLVALYVIAYKAINTYFPPAENQRETNYEKVHRVVLQLCDGKNEKAIDDEGFGVTLPAEWDIPPIHHTAFNCWHCGTFAGNTQEKLTKRDVEEDGWIDDGKAGVFCSLEHKNAYLEAQSFADVKVSKHAKAKNQVAARAATAKPKANKSKRAKRK